MKTDSAFAFALAAFSLAALHSSWATPLEGAFESIREKLCRPIHAQFGAGNFDILDYPQKPDCLIELVDARTPERSVALPADLAGRITVLLEVNPDIKDSPWKPVDGTAPGLEAYATIRAEFAGAAVQFVSVWTATDGDQQAAALSARTYAAEHGLSDQMLLNTTVAKRHPRGTGKSAYHAFAGVRIPGHRNKGTDVCILNGDGRIAYRAQEASGMALHTTRHILRRLTDPAYDEAVRREFQPENSRALPVVERRQDGLVYRDGFEGYAASHALKLEPCWGFTYATQSRLDARPSLVTDGGRDGSCAALVHTHLYAAGLITYGLQHHFPSPLTDGVLRFAVRRHPNQHVRERNLPPTVEPLRALCVRFGQPDSHAPAGFLFANGAWMKETFVTTFRADAASAAPFSSDGWHVVTVDCTPGRKATVSVDGTQVGQLASEAVDWIGFRMDQPGKAFYVDDVELLYRGDAAELAATHKRRVAPPQRPVEPFTGAETEALRAPLVPTTHVGGRATLAPGAIPRADIVGWDTPYLTFDHPVLAGGLLLHDLRQPGVVRDILGEHKGKIVWVTRTHKGDHSTERNNRRRTSMRSPTVFNRVYRLVNEVRSKGVVVLGVSAHDGGHRHFSACHEDRILTAFENASAHRAMAEDLGVSFDQVIYGVDPEAYDSIFAERFSGQMRLWTRTKRGRLIDGTFAGFGPDAILDRDGRIVMRAAGPDGFTYWTARYCLDRLLDPSFDAACRQEFRNPELAHHKPPILPRQERTGDGLVYRDDFESYHNSYDFGLHPRWGFTYKHYVNPDTPEVFPGEGRNGSKAILVSMFHPGDQFCGNKAGALAARHEFPAPLAAGHFRIFVRRGPTLKFPYFGRPDIFRLAITFYGANGKALDTLTTVGERGEEHFVTTDTTDFLKHWNCYRLKQRDTSRIVNTGVAMAADNWQEIRVVCSANTPATITIDGRPAATLESTSVTAVELRAEVPTSFYVDDAELFYAGDAADLAREHATAMDADLARRQQEWKREAEAWEAKCSRM